MTPCCLITFPRLVLQEIIVRLLVGQHGVALRHLVAAGSPMQQISNVAVWLKQNLGEHMRIDDLAERVNMSHVDLPSTFPHANRRKSFLISQPTAAAGG